jgi:hypothetical protein
MRIGIALLICATTAMAQQRSPAEIRVLPVAVTDARDRSVSGLLPEHFEVLVDSVPRQIVGFCGLESPIALAVVSDEPLALAGELVGPEDELIQTRSLAEAVERLQAAKHLRRTILLTQPSSLRAVPASIRVLQVAPDDVMGAAARLRDRYLLAVEASDATERIVVALKQPMGFPALRVAWNEEL